MCAVGVSWSASATSSPSAPLRGSGRGGRDEVARRSRPPRRDEVGTRWDEVGSQGHLRVCLCGRVRADEHVDDGAAGSRLTERYSVRGIIRTGFIVVVVACAVRAGMRFQSVGTERSGEVSSSLQSASTAKSTVA